jgi:hypothetical protein
MREVLLFLVTLMGVGAFMFTATVVVGVHLLRRRVRLAKGPRVPLRWAVSTSHAARLHRRLRRVDGLAASLQPQRRRRRTVVLLPSQEYAGSVRQVARRLDAELLVASRVSPAARRTRLPVLQSGVQELEVSMLQLQSVVRTPTAEWQSPVERIGLFTESFHNLGTN